MPSFDYAYSERYWEGEPLTGVGITHFVGIDRIGMRVAACGRFVVYEGDFPVPADQVVTCLRCWYRGFLYPNLIRWS